MYHNLKIFCIPPENQSLLFVRVEGMMHDATLKLQIIK